MGVATVATTLVGVLAPYLRTEFAISAGGLGLLVTIYAVFSGLGSWPAGTLTDHLGGHRMLIIVFGLAAVALVGVTLSFSYAALAVTMVVAGIANSAANPATNEVIAETVASGRTGVVAGMKMAGVQVAVFATGLSIPVFERLMGWRGPVAAGALLVCLAGAVGVTRIRPDPPADRTGRRTKLVWSWNLAVLTVYSFLMSAAASAVLTYLSLYSVDQLGATPGLGGAAVAIAGLLAIAGRLYWGNAVEHTPNKWLLLMVVGTMAAASAALFIVAGDAGSATFWIGVLGIGAGALAFSAPTTVTLILSVPRGQTGAASGVVFIGFMIGFGAGPAAFGALVGHSGSYDVAWTMVSALCLLAAGVALFHHLSERRHPA